MKTLKLFFVLLVLFIPIFVFGENGGSVLDIILGGMTFNYFIAMFLFALVGVIINLFSDVQRRNKSSKNSPKEFSFKYWWKDNWKRVTATIVLLPIALLTTTDMFGVELTNGVAISIGFGADHIIEIIKHKKIKLIKSVL